MEKGCMVLPDNASSHSINKKRGMKSTTGERMLRCTSTDASFKNILLLNWNERFQTKRVYLFAAEYSLMFFLASGC
jgi:hypothetical protein